MQRLSSTRSSKASSPKLTPALKRGLGVIAIIVLMLGVTAVYFLPANAAPSPGAQKNTTLLPLAQLLHRASFGLRAASAFTATLLGFEPLAAQAGSGNSFSISTVVGGGFSTNVAVKQAPSVLPTAVARDPLGRGFYFIDETANFTYLRFVNTSAAAVTLAGATIQPNSVNLVAGSGALTSDGAPARDTDLTSVSGLAVDPTGNAVYICTPFLNAIRAVNVGTENFTVLGKAIAPGTMATIVTPNLSEVRALIIHPTTHDFFFIGPAGTTQAVYQLSTAGVMGIFAGGSNPESGNGDGGFATAAKLTAPAAMAFDAAGNMLIAEGGDTRNNPGAIRKVNTGGMISTLAGSLAYPNGVAITPGGQIYATLGNAQQIVRVNLNGSVTRVAGNTVALVCDLNSNPGCGDGGAALNANFSFPGSTDGRGVLFAADSTGLLIPDFDTHRVRYVNLSGATVTIAGVSIGSAKIESVVGNGVAVPFDQMSATATELVGPTGVAADAQGNLFISDTGNIGRLRFVNRGASPVTLFAGAEWEQTVPPGQIVSLNKDSGQERLDDRISTIAFASPQGLAATAQGVFIVDSQNGVLFPPGLPTLTQKRTGLIRFLNTSANNVTVLGVTVPPGMCSTVAGQPQGTAKADIIGPVDNIPATQSTIVPTDVAVDAGGNLYIADQGDNKIRKVSTTGTITTFYGGTTALLNGATGLAFDSAGRLHIADTKNNRVLRQDTAGGATFSVIADSSKGINKPRDLTVSATGQVFVVNAGTHQIMKIVAPTNALGTVSVVAGTGAVGFSGDGGPAKQARLSLPTPGTASNDVQLTANIITLADGSMVFTDSNNNRLRELDALPNVAPVLADVANQTMNEGASLQLTFTATDVNEDPLTLSLAGKPSFGTFTDNGNGTATLQLTPGSNDSGIYNLGVTASDSALSATINFTLTVNDVNRAPVVTAGAITSPIRATVAAGASVNLQGSATDPDGDAITYKWFDGANQIASAATVTVTLSIGNHSLFLMATDSKNASASTTAQAVSVLPPLGDNQPPVAVAAQLPATIEATSPAGASVNLNGSGSSDPDQDTLSYSWQDNGTQIATGVTAAVTLALGNHSLTLTVTDGKGGISTTAAQAVQVIPSQDYTIFTVAGNGIYGLCGNNMPATTTCFKEITALNVDKNGEVLIVDGPNRNVRRVNAQGQIVAVAGNSTQGNTGDGKAAALASFGLTAGVAADQAGNIYVSDANNNRVRIVTPDGKIAHFAGDANAIAGNIGDGGQAATARLRRPTRLATDAQGNLYIADSGNNRIRRVDAVTKVITTVAGNGAAGYSGDNGPATAASINTPAGLTLDAQNNLYLADTNNHRIRKVDAITKVMTTIAGDGTAGYSGEDLPATQSSLNSPTGVAVDGAGNVYIADQNNHRLRLLTLASGRLSTITGQGVFAYAGDNGKAKFASVAAPSDVALQNPSGRALFLADNGNRRVRKLDKDVRPNNLPVPVAKPLPTTVSLGQSVTLDGTDSSDPDGDTLTFSWTDNGVEIATTAVANITLSTGTHSIILTVNDGHGGVSSTAAQTVTVGGSSIVVSSIFPSSGNRGDNVSITIIGSGFIPQSQISISGVGVNVFTKYVSSTKLTATVMISNSAFAGYRNLTVKNPNGDSATKTNVFQIK